MVATTEKLPRNILGSFLPNPRAIMAFEDLQSDAIDMGDALAGGAFVVLASSDALGSARILTPVDSILLDDQGPGGELRIGLTNTGVAAGSYGSDSEVVSITVNTKGRVTAIEAFGLESGNVVETSNLYFTVQRAQEAVTQGDGALTGSYTPTLAALANVDAFTAFLCNWQRYGDMVSVSGRVDVDPTASATLTQLYISLPIASTFVSAQDAAGLAIASNVAGQGGGIYADTISPRVILQYVPTGAASQPMFFTMSYRILP